MHAVRQPGPDVQCVLLLFRQVCKIGDQTGLSSQCFKPGYWGDHTQNQKLSPCSVRGMVVEVVVLVVVVVVEVVKVHPIQNTHLA